MRDEARAILPMALAFAVVMPLAVWLARPFQFDAAPVAPQDPTQGGSLALLIGGALGFVALAIGLAVFILWAVRTNRKGIIRAIVLSSVATSLLVVLARPLLLLSLYIHPDLAWGLGLVATAGVAVALWKKPDWRLLNVVGILVAAAVAGLSGAVLGVTPLLLLLAAVAVYDFVAVKRTKHMVKLARTAMDLRLPIALQFGVPPTQRPQGPAPAASTHAAPTHAASTHAASTPTPSPPRSEPTPSPPTGAPKGPASAPAAKQARRKGGYHMVLGLGDLVFPSALLVAAADPRMDWNAIPAIGTALGVAIGFAILMREAMKGHAQPGLPLLNGGAIVGFLVGLFAGTGSLVFW